MSNKWIPLDGKKDPPINQPLAFGWDEEKGLFDWRRGYLKKIEIDERGKHYVFWDDKTGDDHIEYDYATHYLIPSSPNEVKPPKKEKK